MCGVLVGVRVGKTGLWLRGAQQQFKARYTAHYLTPARQLGPPPIVAVLCAVTATTAWCHYSPHAATHTSVHAGVISCLPQSTVHAPRSCSQSLARLTHLTARQLAPWHLDQPHTCLSSLTLTMAWPWHVAALLPALPRLRRLHADLYVYAEYDTGRCDRQGRQYGSKNRVQGGRRGQQHGGGRRVRGREHGGVWAEEADGEWTGEQGRLYGGGYGVEELYGSLSYIAGKLAAAEEVQLQLSATQRDAPWEWGLVLRAVAPLWALRGLTLRVVLPSRGEPGAAEGGGPPVFKAQHFVNLCRWATGRRITCKV